MLLHLVYFVALLQFGNAQNRCVNAINALKGDLQEEVRDVVRDGNQLLNSKQNVVISKIQELLNDKAINEDFRQKVMELLMAVNDTIATGNQLVTNTMASNWNKTQQLLTAQAMDCQENILQRANKVIQILNVSATAGNEHELVMDTLSEIIKAQKEIKNITAMNSNNFIPVDQCVTRNELQTEIRSIIQTEMASLTNTVAEIQNSTAQLLETFNKTEQKHTNEPITELPTSSQSTKHSTELPTTGLTTKLNTELPTVGQTTKPSRSTTTDRLYTCNGTPKWRRLVLINMTDSSYDCPPGLRLTHYSKRTCGRVNNSFCFSTTFSVGGSEYSQVCGRIRGYQVGYTQAFHTSIVGSATTIEENYVSGVSLTYGAAGERMHIWTFAAGVNDGVGHGGWSGCPCATPAYYSPPYVSQDFFCETGVNSLILPNPTHGVPFLDDPLWDGQNCSMHTGCCQYNSPPWFTRYLPEATTDDIEMRICLSNRAHESDIAVELIELYIQ